MKRKVRVYFGCLVGVAVGILGLGSILVFGGVSAFATNINASVNSTNPSSNLVANITPTVYYLNVSSATNLNITMNPSADGTVTVVADNINTRTNSTKGYQLFLSANGSGVDDNKLINTANNNHKFNPTTGTMQTPVELDNNTWGFAVKKNAEGVPANNFDANYITPNPGSNAKFALVPLNSQPQLIQEKQKANSENQTAGGTDLEVYYGAKANLATAAGVYNVTITYTAIANPIEVPSPTFGGIETMQEMTTDICNEETTPNAFVGGGTSGTILSATTRTHTTDKNFIPEAELIDTRDNKKYVIRKFADGNCWMVQNLDLGNTGQSLNLTPSDTDIVSNFVLNNISNPGVSWPTSTNQSNVDTVRAIDNGNKWLTNVSSGNNEIVSTSEPSNPEEKLRHIGNYYNWYTATAGSGNYNMSSGNASHSICSKGWRLPFGEANTTNKSFQRLTDTYKITNGTYVSSDVAASYKLRSKPLSIPLSGHYWSTLVGSQGSGGWFWSSTVGSQGNARNLGLYASSVGPQGNSNKVLGFSVRCVAH